MGCPAVAAVERKLNVNQMPPVITVIMYFLSGCWEQLNSHPAGNVNDISNCFKEEGRYFVFCLNEDNYSKAKLQQDAKNCKWLDVTAREKYVSAEVRENALSGARNTFSFLHRKKQTVAEMGPTPVLPSSSAFS